ncbi:MAG: type VI secretion system tip protein TssI/VgrG [Myxococcota bacterium]
MNERWVTFHAPPLDGVTVEVMGIEGEERFNALPALHVEIRADASLIDAARELMNQELVRLSFEEGGVVARRFVGLVTDVALRASEDDRDANLVRISLAPRLWRLQRRYGSEIFVDATYPEIIRRKLEAGGFVVDRDFRLGLAETYPRRELTVQYEETDLAFVQRLCEFLGVITFFDHGEARDVWCLTDMPSSLPRSHPRHPIPVRARTDHPAAYDVVTRLSRPAQRVVVHDYNYRAPRLALLEEAEAGATGRLGERVAYGTHTKDPAETARTARIRRDAEAAEQERYEGGCSVLGLEVGQPLVLEHAQLGTLELMVTKLSHRARERDGERTWDTRFEAIPATTPFRPRPTTPWPRIRGLINARIDGEVKGHYAELDEAGRYHVQLGFDRSGRTDRKASHPVRMMQPHAGAHYGMHFPLRPGAEVLLGFVDGNPDRPIIVGTAPNPENASPVDVDNFSQNVLRTKSGNEMVLEDELGQERIRIHSPNANTTLQLGSVDEPEEGILLQTDGHVSQVSRGTHSVASQHHTTLTGTNVTLATGHAVTLAGLADAHPRALDTWQSGAMQEGLAALGQLPSDDDDADDPSYPGLDNGPAGEDEGDDVGSAARDALAGLWSAMGATARETAVATAFDAIGTLAGATDDALDDALPRAQGDRLGAPMGPIAAVGSPGTSSLFGRDTALVYGDRVAAVSSRGTAVLVGESDAEVLSHGRVEIAGATTTLVTSGGELSQEANTVRIVGGFYPDAVAENLDDTTSVGILSRQDLRLRSTQDCILVCAQKNLVATAHEGEVRLEAAETMRLSAASLEGYAGYVRLEAEDVSIQADNEFLVEASTVIVRASSITLDGNVTVTGNLSVGGKLDVKDDTSLASG